MDRHTAVYLRVSSRKQDVRSQEPDLKRWIDAFATDMQVRWYRDKFTGRSMHRPGWKQLEKNLDLGLIDRVVIWRLDRLGRTVLGLSQLFEKLIRLKIGLVSIRDGLDLSTPAGRLMANLLASCAAYESEVNSERVLAGQAVARANGKTWGGSEKGRRLKVTDEQIEVVRRLYREDAKVSAIARAVGLSRPTIYSVIEQYCNGRSETAELSEAH